MKRLFLAIAILGLFAPVAEKANAEVSINFFYDTLGGYGNWVEVPTYGYVWQPTVAVGSTTWRPYADGYWGYTDVGWTWVSYEDFGWATYHYGRWVRLRDRGWFWVPGYTWAPAWVSWRAGGDYIGWAPLPPDFRDEVVYEGRPVYGYVDAEYDIGPLYYNFVDVRYIGEPVLRERIFDPTQNVVYVERTVNVTNITYNNNVVYNYGPDYNTVSAYSTRPVLRMALQRETVADPVAAAQSGALMQKQGDKLVVAAPLKLEKPAATPPPKVVKEKIAQPVIEKGWSGIADQKTVAQLKQKIKSENPKQVPPPDIKPKPGASVPVAAAPAAPSGSSANPQGASALPGRGASPATPASPRTGANAAAKGNAKNQHGVNAEPAAATNAAPAASAAPSGGAAMPPSGKGKHKASENARPIAPPDAAAPAQPNSAATAAPQPKGKGKHQTVPHEPPSAAPAVPPAGVRGPEAHDVAAPTAPNRGKGNAPKVRPVETTPPVNAGPNIPPPSHANDFQSPGGKHRGSANPPSPDAVGAVPPQYAAPPPIRAPGRGEHHQQVAPQPAIPQAGGALGPQPKPGKGEKQKGKPGQNPPGQ